MTEKSDGQTRERRLPVICDRCGSRAVVAQRIGDRMLIRCTVCDAQIFSYTLAPGRPATERPQGADMYLVRQIELALLDEVGQATGALYEFLRRYVSAHGYAPTLREMQSQFGWRSPNAATHHLQRLEAAGLIERDYGEPRGIRLPHMH